jgi:transcriptional regulator with XRE-family HTH domain
MTTLSQNLSNNLRRRRNRMRLSQQAVADRAELSVSYVSMLERGQRSAPLDTLEILAAALHVHPLDLLRTP